MNTADADRHRERDGAHWFSRTNWNTAQPVEVTAGQDDDAVEDTATLTHTASGGDYNSVTKDLLVTVTDNDTPGLVLSKMSSWRVAEGSSDDLHGEAGNTTDRSGDGDGGWAA